MRWLPALLCALIAALAATAAAARAADRIYWANYNGNSISYANLNGSGGGVVPTGAETIVGPMGMAIHSASGRIYWSNWGLGPIGDGKAISYANLDGSGGRVLLINPALVNAPHGLAIDEATGRLYWPNTLTNTISFANLNGSGGGTLRTGAATVNSPRGVAIDPKSRRIYWANWGANRISFARLNGSGGRDLATGDATVQNPEGVAIDPATQRIYWANFSTANKLSFAELDGSGGGDVATGAVPIDHPHGLAIDPIGRRLYWPNAHANSIGFAGLGGGSGALLPIPGVPVSEPDQPVLLKRPVGRRAAVTGGDEAGSTLRCRATWAPDRPEALMYREPSELAFRWIRNGDVIGRSASLRDAPAGRIRCRVIGRNAAGQAAETSRTHRVIAAG